MERVSGSMNHMRPVSNTKLWSPGPSTTFRFPCSQRIQEDSRCHQHNRQFLKKVSKILFLLSNQNVWVVTCHRKATRYQDNRMHGTIATTCYVVIWPTLEATLVQPMNLKEWGGECYVGRVYDLQDNEVNFFAPASWFMILWAVLVRPMPRPHICFDCLQINPCSVWEEVVMKCKNFTDFCEKKKKFLRGCFLCGILQICRQNLRALIMVRGSTIFNHATIQT